MHYCHSREGGNPEKWENSTFYEIVNIRRSMLIVRLCRIRRSMFDVQSFHCSGQGESHISTAAGLKSGQFNRKDLLGERLENGI
jgi:hypothetical protein